MEHLMEYFYLFLPKLEALGFLGYWIVFLVSYLEALVVVGSIIPGATFIVFAGLFAALGVFDIKDLIWFAAIGTILGDLTSYYLGTKGTYYFKNENKLLNLAHLEKGKDFFKKHGGKSLLLGKILMPIKAIIPFVAGLSHMEKYRFLAWSVASGFAWALLYLYLGYFFGSAWETIEMWISRAGIFLLVLLFAIFLLRSLAKRRADIALILSSTFLAVKEKILQNGRVQRFALTHPKLFSFARARVSTQSWHGLLLTLFSVLLALLLLAFAGITDNILGSDPIVFADVNFEKLLRFFRNPYLAAFFRSITYLGEAQIAIILSLAALGFMWGYNKRAYILPLLVILAGETSFVFLTKQIVERIRPDEFEPLWFVHTYSFPSGHAAFAFAFFGFLAYFAARNLSSWKARTNAFFAGTLIIFLIGLSRLYLGVHFLSDVIGGYLVGAIWLVVGITLAEWSLSRRGNSNTRNFPDESA